MFLFLYFFSKMIRAFSYNLIKPLKIQLVREKVALSQQN